MGSVPVLLVDPDHERRDRTRRGLRAAAPEIEVRTVGDPDGGRAVLESTAIACVLVDTENPESDVFDLVEHVRSDEEIPVVLLTDAGSEALAVRAIECGVDAYLRRQEYEDPYQAVAEEIRTLVATAAEGQRAREEQVRVEQFFDLAGSILLALDTDGQIERINDHGASVLGYDPEEMVGADWFDLAIPDDDREPMQTAFAEMLADGAADYRVLRNDVVTKEGTVLTVEWRTNVIQDESGAVQGTLSAGRDVTEQRAQAAAIEAERDRFAALFENIPEPAIVASFEDGNPIVKRVNPAFEDVFGYDMTTVIGENVDDFIVPETDTERATSLNDDLSKGKSVQAEVTRLTTSGPRVFRLNVVPVDPEQTNVEGYAIYEDITELKKRQTVLEGLHTAAAEIVGAETATEACERTVAAAEEILQFDLCEISLEEDGYLVPAASSAEMDEDVPYAAPVEEGIAGQTYRTGESFVIDDLAEAPGANPQGSWKAALSVPIGDHGIFQAASEDAGTFDTTHKELAELLVSHTAETLTRLEKESELRDREAALQVQNQRLEKFTNVLSHDLRNPLTVASGELELAMAESDHPRLETVAQAHERMQDLIEDVLMLARSSENVTEPESVPLGRLSTECFANVDTAEATLHVESEGVIRADPTRMQSLLENLFRNAIEHGSADITVTVGDLSDGFYVADDGPGIPADERERVLEAGYSTREKGTGLGLNIVAETVEAHGWTIEITESADGGARFEFTGVTRVDEAVSDDERDE